MKISCRRTRFEGLSEIFSEPISDHRGIFARLYDEQIFASFAKNIGITQESLQHSAKKNTVRGLHFSLPPQQESKIITAIRGVVQWICVDLRRQSPTFGQWHGIALSAVLHNSLAAEEGFAHGCVSLADNSEVLIKANVAFDKVRHSGIIWNDKNLNIGWITEPQLPIIISEEHQRYPTFEEFLARHGGEL